MTVKPRDRCIELLRHSLCFIAKGSTKVELCSNIVLEILPKLIITHMVELANDHKHVSILALRRLVNFIRLFRLCIEIVPDTQTVINEKLRAFKDDPGQRLKDFTPSLGDMLTFSVVSD